MEFDNKETQFDFYWNKIFSGLKWNPIEFNVYRFDESTSLPSKFNKLYEMFKQLALNNQQVMDYLKEFERYVNDKLKKEHEDIMEWLNGYGLTSVVEKIFDEWVQTGKMQDLLNPSYEIIFNEWLDSLKEKIGDGDIENLLVALQDLDERVKQANYYVTPEMFGAFGDGVRDDTDSLNNMFVYAKENNRVVNFRRTTYKISKTIYIDGEKVKLNFNNATILIDKEYTSEDEPITAIKIFNQLRFSSLSGLNLKAKQKFRHYGIVVDVGMKWIEYNHFTDIHIDGFIDNFRINMGGGNSTESGVVYNNFTNCSFTNFSNLGFNVYQPNINTGSWMNQNVLNNCKFGHGHNGFEVMNVSTQNLIFNECSFEILGFHNTTTNDFNSAFGFRGNRVTSVYFNNPYFENISPYRVASQTEISDYTNSNETSNAGNKKIGNYELFYDYYNQTIRPISANDPKNYGNIIVDNNSVFPKVVVNGGIISMSIYEVSLLRDGELTFNNNKLYHTTRRPNACYQGVITLSNKVNNPHIIESKNNRFSAERILSKYLNILGVLGSNSSLTGDFFTETRTSNIIVNATTINNVNNLYLDVNNGNDLNVGFLKDYPCKTIDQILWRLNLIKDSAVINVHIIGDFTIDKLFTISNKRVNFVGDGTIYTKEIVNQNNGFYYMTIKNCSLSFTGFKIKLLDLSFRPSFIFNFLLYCQDQNIIEFNNCSLESSDDSFPSLINNVNGDLFVYFNNCTFTEGGSIIRGYNNDVRIKININGNTGRWQYPKIKGETSERPLPKYLVSGLEYYDTTINKKIYYDGTNWIDYTGNIV